ncbi:MAG TPA: anti-sigma factor [Acidimicrobiia bacterium]|nr:anti-sigma factor [Acidimicrobiia bacterium]
MNCEEARVAMLEGDRPTELENHLSGCSDCRGEQVALARIRETLREPTLWEEPAPELAERIASQGRAAVTQPRRQISARIFLPVTAGLSALLVAAFLLVSSPADWEFDLRGVGEGADASAVVAGWNDPEGTRLRIEVEGIESPPPGQYYEIWLTSPDGLHVSAGTFRGDGVINASVGVRRADFPRLWITLESVDGDSGPSSNTYFDTA